MRLKQKMFLTNIVLLIVCFLIFSFLCNRVALSYLIASYSRTAMGEMQGEIAEIEYIVNYGRKQLKKIAKRNEILLMNWEESKEYLFDKTEDGPFQKIGLVYVDGSYHITSEEDKGNLLSRDYVHKVLAGEPTVSTPLYSLSDGRYQVVLAEPIVSNGSVVGAVIGGLLMEEIENTIYALSIDYRGAGFLLDSEGNFLINLQGGNLSQDNFFAYMEQPFSGKSGYSSYIDEAGDEHYVFYKQLEETQWYAAISITEEEFMEPILELTSKLYAILLGVLIILVLGINIIINSFTNAIEDLINGMRTVEQGDYSLQIASDRKDEIGEIATQFNKTIEAISYRDEELQAFNEELCDSFEKLNEANQKLIRAHGEISYNYQQQKTINQLAEKLYRAKGLDQLLETIIIHTHEIMGADQTLIFFHDDENKCFKVKASKDYTDEEIHKLVFSEGEGTYQEILDNKELAIIHDINREQRFKFKLSHNKRYKMLMHLPILGDGERVIGCINYFAKALNMEYIPILKQISKIIAITVENEQLILQEKETYFEIIISLVKAMDLKDPYTKGHSERVMNYSLKLGKQLNLTATELESLRRGSILHDIGKLGIPDEILLKKGRLTEQEFNIIKGHSIKGVSFIDNLKFLQSALSIIRNHHERYDGTGYPDGLQGDEIPLLTRIVTIADAYDAMVSEREYRKKFTKEEAIGELKRNRGTQFDPLLVDEFIKII